MRIGILILIACLFEHFGIRMPWYAGIVLVIGSGLATLQDWAEARKWSNKQEAK